MNCREFKAQFEDGRNLSEKANAHIESCRECETLRMENLQLTQVISSLPMVEAPKDFEFGFKAKLANSQSNKSPSAVWQVLRYLLPLTAAAVIFGFVFVDSNLFAPPETQQMAETDKAFEQKKSVPIQHNSFDELEETKDKLVAENDSRTDEPKVSEKQSGVTEEKVPIGEIADNKTKKSEKDGSDDEKIITKDMKPESDSPKIFDRDSAVLIPKPINPPGINPEREINKSPMPQITKVFTAKDILSQLGIITENSGGRLKVVSVRPKSTGANSGVKIGDMILAIDGQAITNRSIQNRMVRGKSLTVKRGGKNLNISLKN